MKQKRRQVSIDDATVEALKKIGDGNLSLGIRRAAEALACKS